MPSVGMVSAFVGPLLVGIGLIGGFIAWLNRKSQERLKNEFKHYAELNALQFRAMTEQLGMLSKMWEAQQKKVDEASTAVARVEGVLLGRKGTDL